LTDSKIKKFTASEPDGDGDVRINMTAKVKNESGENVRLITVDSCVFGPSGGASIGDRDMQHQTRLEPDALFDLGEMSFYAKSAIIGADPKTIRAKIKVGLFTRAFTRVEVEVPEGGKSSVKTVEMDGVGQPVIITVSRRKPDDDGDANITVSALIDPDDQALLSKMRVEILDDEGVVIQDGSDDDLIGPHVQISQEPGFWGLKDSALAGTKIRVDLALYRLIRSVRVERTGADPA
jgi:hypothetical protein